jgi:hypothetical protein
MGADRTHAARVYGDADELVAAVADFVADGWVRQEPAVLVATPEHSDLVLARLERDGVPTDRLLVADAETTLASIMDGDEPSPAKFEEVVGGLLDEARRRFGRKSPRIFGEMVDLLCRDGHAEAAAELEKLWNRLQERRRFSLLCGYHLDVFDGSVQMTALPDVCTAHTRVAPAADERRFADAVDRALADVLGAEDARLVRSVVEQDSLRERVPAAQLALMWVSRNMPFRAGRVLRAARANYAA